VEADFDSLKMNASQAVTSSYVAIVPGVPFVTTTSIGTDWLFTARGRLGWTPVPQLLLYSTGGLAVARINVTNSFRDFDPFGVGLGASNSSSNKAGWTVGGGAEWMLTPNWSMKAEYLFVDLGQVLTTGKVFAPSVSAASNPLTSSFNLTIQIARAGLNYKF
jgi:outer membrane immunogenic protein